MKRYLILAVAVLGTTVLAVKYFNIRSDINGEITQQANDLVLDEDNMILYISYGTKDADNAGSETASFDGYIDVISVGEDTHSQLTLSILHSIHIPNIDLYGLALDKTNGKLYVSAGADADAINSDKSTDNDINSGSL
ncbi:MAG: hypothetical protein ACK5MI_08885 [Mangrovibacterium sp.]